MLRALVLLGGLGASFPALGQQLDAHPAGGADSDRIEVPAVTEPQASKPGAVWVGGVSGGLLARDGATASPYATVSLTRYKSNMYLRAAFTTYRSTIQQPDAALPSTYTIGSLGAGGNLHDWVVDAFASYGYQRFGLVSTQLGSRSSTAGSGASYLALGMRAGHIWRLDGQTFLTPTASVQYVKTQSLRHLGGPAAFDFRLPESAWSGSAAVRLDRSFGKHRSHSVGFSYEHFLTDNGLTSFTQTPSGPGSSPVPTPAIIPDRKSDGWNEMGVNTMLTLSRKFWLDLEVKRAIGALAGNSTTATVGIRFRL